MHIGVRALHVLNLKWYGCIGWPIPVGRRGGISSFKLFLLLYSTLLLLPPTDAGSNPGPTDAGIEPKLEAGIEHRTELGSNPGPCWDRTQDRLGSNPGPVGIEPRTGWDQTQDRLGSNPVPSNYFYLPSLHVEEGEGARHPAG